MSSWNAFISQFKRDLKQWLFFMALLSVMRLILIVVFSGKIGETTLGADIFKTFVNGLRYDVMVTIYCTLIPLLMSVVCGFADFSKAAERVRALIGRLFIILSVILSIVTIGYFKEYNDQFNHWIFNLYYDDTRAILSTIWAEYHLVPNLIAACVVSFIFLKLYGFFMKRVWLDAATVEQRSWPLLLRVAAAVAIVSMVVTGLRGSYGHRTLKLEDAAVTRDEFLNKAVLNPYSALMYAYRAHTKILSLASGLQAYLPDGDVRKAARELLNRPESFPDLDAYLKRTALGHRNKQPSHIFLVVMESYDAWPLLQQYSSLGLTHELSTLAAKGIHIAHFLPASDGTATSVSALITGLPDVNVVTNYQKTSRKAYSSSIAESFKRLGYRTRFFYGGYLSWQKLGDFVKAQGFEDIYGAAHIGTWASHNEWGVEDEALFDFVIRTVGSSPAQPSLNVIMTTSYHPPYELDVYRKGFSVKTIPADLASRFDESVSLKMLGHLWYADHCIGDFVRAAENKFDLALFAFTGDHYGRKFINLHPDFFEGSAVPFVLYGKDVLRGVNVPANTAGSHIDISPTLIEISAPKGFTYYSLGSSMFAPLPARAGIGRDKIVASNYLFDVAAMKFHPLPDRPLPKKLPDPKQLKLTHDRMSGIAWWRIMRGEKL